MPPIIRVENLGKKYALRHQGEGRGGYRRFSEELLDALQQPFRRADRHAPNGRAIEEFWALRNVSFEVQQGEVLGIIGRNGAGKSTLLKILSRITEPSEGRVRLRGRATSLLEVGTGFHPELTGRENVFLNGAILGMSRAEIREKFDEIIAFAEVERFIDTPVKRYSSGMYVRLAFAVAAHLEPEILIIDEVLAVGDAAFQKKCLGKMSDVARGGRTILFVSHNLHAVRSLCKNAAVFQAGALTFLGTVDAAIESYLGRVANVYDTEFAPDPSRPSITRVSVDSPALARGALRVAIAFESPFPLSRPVPGVLIQSASGTPVYGSNPRFHGDEGVVAGVRAGVAHLLVENLPICAGDYRMSVWLGDWQTDYDQKIDALAFHFSDGQPSSAPSPEVIGYVATRGRWHIQPHDPLP